MRKLVPFLTGLGLVAAAAASADPAKLSEGELGRVAAGQTLGGGFSVSTFEAMTSTETTTNTSNVRDNDTATSIFDSSVAAEQSLAGQSSNTVNALGLLGSGNVSATGNANAMVSGTLANTVP